MAGVALAAGFGVRLRPLSRLRPKPLCPVGGRPLVELAAERLAALGVPVAVNAHQRPELFRAALGPDVHLSVEEREPLGTAGALGRLRGWLDGRGVVVVNADTWCPAPLAPLLEGWDGERVRLLLHAADALDDGVGVVASLLPWAEVARLRPQPSGLYGTCWRPAAAAGRLEVLRHDGPWVDCGTPADYLRANLLASGGRSVVGEGAVVRGRLVRSVVWDGATVAATEVLVGAVRADRGVTVLVR